jgi:hypothetical protein
MTTNWSREETLLGRLTTQAQRYLATFRWLWLTNVAAAIIGVATRHYWLTALAVGSSFAALIGVAFARRGCKTVSEATAESHRIQRKEGPASESDSLES